MRPPSAGLSCHSSQAREILFIDLRALATIPGLTNAVSRPHAKRLADFLNNHRFRRLNPRQKIERVRQAPPWNPGHGDHRRRLGATAPGRLVLGNRPAAPGALDDLSWPAAGGKPKSLYRCRVTPLRMYGCPAN